MQMNSNIPLSINNVDVMGAIDRGTQAAGNYNAMRRQNALADVYRTQGAGIMAGDQTALNALAGIDPAAAMDMQNSQLGMAQTRQNMQFSAEEMQMRRDEAKRAASAEVLKMSADQRAQEAAQIERGLTAAGMAYKSGDKQAYDAILLGAGMDPAQLPFEQFPMHAAQFGGVLDALKAAEDVFAPPKAPEYGDRFKVVGSQLVDLGAEGGPKSVLTDPGQMETVFGPDGQPIVQRGPAGSGKPFTEGQSKDIGFATRARAALTAFEPVAGALTSRGQKALEYIPLGLGRELQTDEFQVATNAGKNLLLAILRKDTGAAVTPAEEEIYGSVFLPQSGDGQAVLEQKAQARALAVAGLEQGMPADAILAQGRAIMQATGGANSGSQPQPQQPAPIAGSEIDALLQKYSSP